MLIQHSSIFIFSNPRKPKRYSLSFLIVTVVAAAESPWLPTEEDLLASITFEEAPFSALLLPLLSEQPRILEQKFCAVSSEQLAFSNGGLLLVVAVVVVVGLWFLQVNFKLTF